MSSQELTKEQINKIRDDVKFTIEQFAYLLNVSVRTVQRWQSSGVDLKAANNQNLDALVRIMEDEKARETFMSFKDALVGSRGSLSTLGVMGFASVGSILPILGLMAGGLLSTQMAPEVLKVIQNYLTQNTEK